MSTSIRRSSVAAVWLAASSLAVVTPAFAENIVEVQLDATRVLALITAEAAKHEDCFSPFTCPGAAEQCIIDHLEFPSGAALRRMPGAPVPVVVSPAITVQANPLQGLVPVKPFVKTLACAEDPQCDETFSTTLNLVLDLSVSAGSLCVSVAGLEGLEGVDGVEGIVADLQSSVGTVCMPASPAGSLSSILGDDHVVTGGGISADLALTRVAIRSEFDGTTTPAQWSAFFAGSIAPAAPQKDWAVFVHQDFLRSVVVDRVTDAIAGSDDLSLAGSPSSDWDAATPGLSIDVEGNKDVDNCPVDIGFDATFDGAFSLSGGALVLQLAIDVSPYGGDALACVLLGPTPKSSILAVFLTFLVDALTADVDIPTDGLPAACTADGTDITCTFPLSAPPGFVVDTLLGNSSGLVIAGTVPLTPAPTPASMPDIDVTPITYGASGDCNSLHIGYEGSAFVPGPGRLCAAYLLNDPIPMFGVGAPPANTPLPQTLTLDFTNDPASPYFEPGGSYSPDLVVITTRGARAVTIPAVKAPSSADKQVAIYELIMAKVNCMARAPEIGIGDFIPNWEDPDWGTHVWFVDLVSRAGSTKVGAVTLSDHLVRLLPVGDHQVERDGDLNLPAQAAVLFATAAVDAGRLGRIEVPIEVPLTLHLAGRLDRAGNVELVLVQDATATVHVPAGADSPFASISFALSLPPRAFELEGPLTVE